jgi:FMN phosphatase YigB (HAD superfamily)
LIFRKALLALKVQAQEAIYIDDIAAYVEAAQRLGMAGLQFQSPAQLTSDLKTLGVDLS